MCAVPNMAVFCSFMASYFLCMLITYILNGFEIVIVFSICSRIFILLLLLFVRATQTDTLAWTTTFRLTSAIYSRPSHREVHHCRWVIDKDLHLALIINTSKRPWLLDYFKFENAITSNNDYKPPRLTLLIHTSSHFTVSPILGVSVLHRCHNHKKWLPQIYRPFSKFITFHTTCRIGMKINLDLPSHWLFTCSMWETRQGFKLN